MALHYLLFFSNQSPLHNLDVSFLNFFFISEGKMFVKQAACRSLVGIAHMKWISEREERDLDL
jgi:hypothetical protein